MRGEGTIYLRGGVYWAQTWLDGKRVRESLETSDLEEARKRLLKLRKTRERGAYINPTERRVTVGELLDDLQADAELRGVASIKSIRSHLKAVRNELGEVRASILDTSTIRRYQKTRLDAGKKPKTVNTECGYLLQAYRLASRSTPPKVKTVPYASMLTVSNARQGFLAPETLEQLWRAMSREDEDVRDFVEWFSWTGMRPKEIREIEWTAVDRHARTLNLDPAKAKIRRGRVIPLDGPLWAIIQRRWKKRRLDTPLVFHRVLQGRAGLPVMGFRKLWRKVIKAIGLPRTLIPYDLRRTAVRNMVRARIDRSVAKKISGHLTDHTFDRYNIVDEADVRDAMIRTVAFVKRGRRR
jgi:integrase